MFPFWKASNMKREDLDVSVGVGLGISIPLYMISTLPDACGTRDPLTLADAAVMALAFGSYMIVPALLRLPPGRRAARLGWWWTPVLGSLLLTLIHCCWRVLSAKWSVEQSAMLWLLLCLWTLPFAAAAHYSGVMLRRLKRRREGLHDDISILRR